MSTTKPTTVSVETIDMPVYKVKGGWKIENTPGISKTKKEAEQRLKAIKASQSKKKR